MADKQIAQLPLAVVGDLSGDTRLLFQNIGATSDYQLKMSILLTYLASQGSGDFDLYGGSANPSNATGNNRDIYFKLDGSVWKKISGFWVIKSNAINIGTGIDIPAGTSFETGQAYVRITYAIYRAQYGDNPTKWIEYFVDADSLEQKFVSLVNKYVSGVLTYIDVYADPSPSDPTKTADHLQLILK